MRKLTMQTKLFVLEDLTFIVVVFDE